MLKRPHICRQKLKKTLSWSTMKTVLFLLLVLVGHCYDKIGHVTDLEGTLTAVNIDQNERALSKSSDVYAGDTLQTGPSSRGEIKFSDGTILLLIPASSFSVDTYVSGMRKNQFTSKLYEGGMRVSTGLIAKRNPENFQIGTPNATIGVRGTVLEARMVNGELFVGSSSGRVSVANSAGEVQIGTNMPTDFASVASEGSAPQALSGRPSALNPSNFQSPASTAGAAAVEASTLSSQGSSQGFAWGIGVGGLVVIGTVAGITAAAASSSPSTFSFAHFSH